jgi:HEAT repeat protein
MKRIIAASAAVWAALLLHASWSWSQGESKPATGSDFVEEQLEAVEPTRAEQTALGYMLAGRYPADNPSAAALAQPQASAVMQAMLKWYLHRLTLPRVQEARESSVSAIMEDVLGGPTSSGRLFPPATARLPSDDPDQMATRRLQKEYVRVLCNQALPILKQLLRNQAPIVRVNAARVLDRFAFWGRPEILDTLLEIMNHPKESDAVRYWAIEALGKLLGTADYASAGNFGEKDSGGAEYRKAAMAVYRWLDANVNVPAERVAQLQPDEKDAISLIRRHALAALGNTGRPRIVEAAAGGAAPEGAIAEVMVRIMDNSNVSPPASWAERVEAAYQLSRLQASRSSAYQPDFVIQRLATFVANLGGEAAGDSARNRQRWRYFAVHLNDALDGFYDPKTSRGSLVQGSPGQIYLDRVRQRIINVLEYLDDPARNPSAPQELINWVGQNPAASKSVFRE